ncbi:ABC transporter ATP-binding protein [Rhodoligotrophos ferricapiens]|uniref:ABC transporter ATP-binding protein n=1 Tax=Rhodoligotrophos ferricapiens TaxID=3069264 RepID=UPI00315CB7FD
MAEPILRIDGLTAGYGRMTVLHDVSMSVDQGAIVALLGANGAGKTTLLRNISGLQKPRSGTITFIGQNIARTEPHRIVQLGLGHVPEARQPFPQLSVRENLWMGAFTRSRGPELQSDLEMVYSYFPILKERDSQKAGLLSGGEQQMMVIGRALMARPKLLLFDEPSLGLSPRLVKTIFEIVRRINKEQGVSIFLVEQNAHVALEVSDFGYVLESGRVVLGRPSAELAELEDIKTFYLGHASGSGEGKTQQSEGGYK